MPISPDSVPRRRRSRLHGAVAVAGTAALALSVASVPATAAADTEGDDQEIIISDNMSHVAHVPTVEAFTDQSDFNSDLAFTGDYAVAGNYAGFVVYDISDPENPEVASVTVCPGLQNDVSVSGNLVYTSTDVPMESDECGAERAGFFEEDTWEGIRIFDISDPANPTYEAAVRTECGSHTHTVVPAGDETDYIYVNSYMPGANYWNCGPPHDKISVVEVPLDAPQDAFVANDPVLFPDGGNEDQDGLLLPTSGCHDITVYQDIDLAAGACMGDGIIMDISDPVEPEVLERVTDENYAFWHGANFSNDAKTVVFQDELGGGGAPTCDEEHYPELGANAYYSLDAHKDSAELDLLSYYKIPRHQGETENCVAHQGSLIPVPGRDFMVQGWYQGGTSVIDFNDPSNPEEIAYFDRTAYDEDELVLSGHWSAYWYNGYIYANDIQNGLDVLRLDDPRMRAADRVHYEEFNPHSQFRYKPGRGHGRD